MTISLLEGNRPPGGILAQLRELNLTPAEAVLQESQGLQLRSQSPGQLAEMRDFKAQIWGDIDKTRSLFPPPLPPPVPEAPDYSQLDPAQILRRQDPEAYIAFTALSQEAQEEFLALCRSLGFESAPPFGGGLGAMFGGMGGGGVHPGSPQVNPCPAPPPPPRLNHNLLGLLKSGKLTAEDSQGRTLLQNLTTLSQQDMAPNLDRKAIFQQLCAQLDDPSRIRQGTQGTCAPTTIQHLQATRDPAEYARIVVGLTSEEGSVTMRNGDPLQRDRGSLAPDQTGRNDVERIYQAAMMEYANGEDEYDNRTDLHTRADDTTHEGLYTGQTERGLDALFGDKYDATPVSHETPEGRADAESKLRRALESGEQIPVSLNWSERGRHALLVIGMTENEVILRNPWGPGEQGQGGPPREVIDGGGTVSMSKAEFFSRCYNIYLPKENG